MFWSSSARAELVSLPAPGATSLASTLREDTADGRLDRFTLMSASLVAGGVEQSALVEQGLARLETVWREIQPAQINQLPPAARAKAIFQGLHRLVLTGKYCAECTDVQTTLTSGDYNCVTATILYLELCRRHGLTGHAVAIPGHVYCRLDLSPPLEVQTTCREWFAAREGAQLSPEARQFLEQLAAKQATARALNDVALLGKIHYNRGVSLLESQQYGQAITAIEQAIALDPDDEPAHNNLLAAYNNWALQLCDGGQYAEAVAKIEAGRKINAEYGPLLTNDLHVHQKWALALCDAGRHSAALDILEAGYRRRPDVPLFKEGRLAIYGMWLKAGLEDARSADLAAKSLAEARSRWNDSPEFVRHEIAAFEAVLDRCLERSQIEHATRVLSLAQSWHPHADNFARYSAKLTTLRGK